jgi:hypothetical protein
MTPSRLDSRIAPLATPAFALLAATFSVLVIVLAALTLATPIAAAEDAGATWRWAPAEAPPPPGGVEPASFPVPLGQIGDIEFWAPNRGLLITAGTGKSCSESANATVPCGLYAYNGVSWHLLSTECGGANGRIAWAGPDEFWTISDQRPGQNVKAPEYKNLSLCHFLDGQVVGSYAMPLEQPNSYRTMDAAACLSPEDCWFGGLRGLAPNGGAFHLHWDGENVNVVYSPANHKVVSMALANQSTLLESVEVTASDKWNPAEESEAHPFLLHEIEPLGSSTIFQNLFIPDPGCTEAKMCPSLPDYGTQPLKKEGEKPVPVSPLSLAGFSLSSDFTPSGANAEAPQLWAIAAPHTTGNAHPIALRYSEGAWTQVVGNEEPGGGGPFKSGEVPTGVAAEPGAPAAWVTIESHDHQAHVDRLTAEGKISEEEVLGDAQGFGERGSAGPIACPAPHECWLATSEGWLFHLTDGSALPRDTDPNFESIITFRPSDPGVPQMPPNEPPPDDSLANQEAAPPPPPAATVQQPSTLTSKALVTDVSTHVVHRYTLELSFELTVKARVQLQASRKSRRVAQTALETLKAGKHTLILRLNPRKWPNKLNLKATPLEALPTVESKGGGGTTVAPPIKEETVST